MYRKLLLMMMWLFPLSLCAQKIHVVSIGVADYKNYTAEKGDLNFTLNDVNLFNQMLSIYGAEINTLQDSRASHVNIVSALRLAAAKAKPEDILIVYFSGHGYPGGFCCWDFAGTSGNLISQNASDQDLVARASRSHGGLSYQEMQILLRNCRAKRKIVFADACFSGGLRKGEQLNLSVQPVKNGDVIYFLSSQLDETSLESNRYGHGVYTYYLAKGILGEADSDGDMKITLEEIFDYVYPNVLAYSIKADQESKRQGKGPVSPQHPTLWGKYNEGMTIFNVPK